MGDVAQLVRQHAGEFIWRFRHIQQPREHIDAATRQGEGVCHGRAQNHRIRRDRQMRDGL